MALYKIWFDDEPEPTDNEDYFECNRTYLDLVVAKYLEYAYDNRDGWEWMPKNGARTKILLKTVDENGIEGELQTFVWELEYNPSFYVQVKE